MQSIKSREWEVLGKLKESKTQKVKVEEMVEVLLKNRGIKTQKDKKEFFNPTSPEKLNFNELGINKAEVKKAIDRIIKALKTGEKVVVYGDYDADGICATAILWEALHKLGLNVLPYIPERFSEGYGLNSESIKNLKSQDPNLKLIITVDHGIVANKKVDLAKELGIDVIITDHHQPGKTKPKSLALIHTVKIGGAAVAWVLAREITRKFRMLNTKWPMENGLELVAIGTITDQLPLIGPNRSFVKYGLVALNDTKRVGLLALFREAGLIKVPNLVNKIGPYEVSFIIAPRLNAMGRMEHALESLRLLCTKDLKRAAALALHLSKVNLERQKVVDEVILHASSFAKKTKWQGVIILAHETYHEGVIGLAAGKLVEEYYRPAIVISKKKGISKASARSISGFNIIEAIRGTEDLLEDAGGHLMAAGFSIKTELIGQFTRKLDEVSVPLLTEEILTKKIKADMEIDFDQINWDLYQKISEFEPTGLGNPAPTFVSKNVFIENAKVVGRDGKHLSLRLAKKTKSFKAIAFGMGGIYPTLSYDKPVDVVYSVEEDTWNGKGNIQLRIKDIKIH